MKNNWEMMARRQLQEATSSQEQVEILQHALNLYGNEKVIWFPEFTGTIDGREAKHKFGIGVVRDWPVSDPMRVAIFGKEIEDVYIIFWVTENDGFRLFDVYSFDTFVRLSFKDDDPDAQVVERVVPALKRAVDELKAG